MSELIEYRHVKKEFVYDGDDAGDPNTTTTPPPPVPAQPAGRESPAHDYGDTANYCDSVITELDDDSPDFPWPVYKKYFRVLKIEDKVCYKKLKVKCLICVGTKELTMDTRSNSNLRKHLSSKHPVILRNIDHQSDRKSSKRVSIEINVRSSAKKMKTNSSGANDGQHFLDFIDQNISTDQNTLDNLIQRFIISSGMPFVMIENPILKEIISRGFPKNNLMSHATLMKRIEVDFLSLTDKLKSKLSTFVSVATTVDCWSIYKKSYIAINVSWLDANFTRTTCLLAIRRIEGNQSFDVLAKEMDNIYTEFEISHKITYSTTDNGLNFINNFPTNCHHELGKISDDSNSDIDYLNDLQESNDEVEFQAINLSDELMDNDLLYYLPKHHRCAVHTLNLVATVDAKNALLDTNYKKLSTSTFSKCSALWSKQSLSKSYADLIKTCCGINLKIPNRNCLNSLFDSVQCLLKCLKSNEYKFSILMEQLKVTKFNQTDLEFLIQYEKVMTPISICLDILKNSKNMYFGFLLPTIEELMFKLDCMLEDNFLSSMHPLITALLCGIENRFHTIQKDTFFIVAAVSHPFFKSAWIKNTVKQHYAIECFKRACSEISEENLSSDFPNNDGYSQDNASSLKFFTWSSNSQCEQTKSIDCEIDQFLSSSPNKKLDSLNNLPIIKRVFVKYNTPLPSSAFTSVEKVFSIGDATVTKKKTNMTDTLFEQTMFLKCNNHLYDA
ncbi:Hypothetical protein CINCED_3A017677 [Cinara cedri]|nr:Hypothetical protein CINCED_3A017677 [Cinara cedri]